MTTKKTLTKAQSGKIVKSILSPAVTASLTRRANIVSKAKKANKVYSKMVLGSTAAAAAGAAGLAGYVANQAVKSIKPVVKKTGGAIKSKKK